MATVRSVAYGTTTIHYQLVYDRRKTLGITVHPDLSVLVKAPLDTDPAEVDARVHKRAEWILKQQRELERYLPHLPPRQYVSGETHRYLGRQYRLKVLEDGHESVERSRPFIYVRVRDRQDTGRVRQLLHQWYRQEAKTVFADRLAACFPKVERLGVAYPELAVRVMRSRWGSTSPAGRVTLNVKLIQVPTQFIDYVVYHELCHLQEPNHGPRYYELLDRVLPDWRDRRRQLNDFEFG